MPRIAPGRISSLAGGASIGATLAIVILGIGQDDRSVDFIG